ncbi:hypothetical protein ABIC01_008964 [Bradyrhizobium sp. RT4b]
MTPSRTVGANRKRHGERVQMTNSTVVFLA